MAYPPAIYPPDLANDTDQFDRHASDHNLISGAISELIAEVDTKMDLTGTTQSPIQFGAAGQPVTITDGSITASGNVTAVQVTAASQRLTGTGDVSLSSTGHPFQIGPSTGLNLAIDNNEIQARDNGAAASMMLNSSGGQVTVGGDLRVNQELTVLSGANFAQGKIHLYEDGSTTFGNGITISADNLRFGARLGQHIDLYSDSYGIGIQGSTLYYRSAASHRWYIGGHHASSGPGSGGVEAMVIRSDGIVMIGKDDITYDATGVYVGDNNGRVRSTCNLDGSPNLGLNRVGAATGTGEPFVVFDVTTARAGSITRTSSGVGYNTSSDYRIKDDHGEITDGLQRLNTLRPIRAVYHADDSQLEVDAFIAHEVATVVPNAVSGAKDAVTTQADVDAGNASELGAVIPQQLDQTKLIPILVAAVKELSAQVAELRKDKDKP